MLPTPGRRGSFAAVCVAIGTLGLTACASDLGTSETGADDVSASGPTAPLPPPTLPPPGPTSEQSDGPEPVSTGETDGEGPTSATRPPRPSSGPSAQTVGVVPAGPPPAPPSEIDQATVSNARNPEPGEQALLAAIGTALANQAGRVYYVETPRSLEVGKPGPLILGLKEPVRLPRRIASLAEGRARLGVQMALFPYGNPSMEFVEQSEPANFVLDFRSRTLDAVSPTGELARFDVTADETGTHGVWVVLANPRLGGSEVDYSVSVPVREVSVADEGLTTKAVAALMAVAAAFTALATLTKPGYAFVSWVRKRLGGQKSAASGQE
jgi:hypothetical protein